MPLAGVVEPPQYGDLDLRDFSVATIVAIWFL